MWQNKNEDIYLKIKSFLGKNSFIFDNFVKNESTGSAQLVLMSKKPVWSFDKLHIKVGMCVKSLNVSSAGTAQFKPADNSYSINSYPLNSLK